MARAGARTENDDVSSLSGSARVLPDGTPRGSNRLPGRTSRSDGRPPEGSPFRPSEDFPDGYNCGPGSTSSSDTFPGPAAGAPSGYFADGSSNSADTAGQTFSGISADGNSSSAGTASRALSVKSSNSRRKKARPISGYLADGSGSSSGRGSSSGPAPRAPSDVSPDGRNSLPCGTSSDDGTTRRQRPLVCIAKPINFQPSPDASPDRSSSPSGDGSRVSDYSVDNSSSSSGRTARTRSDDSADGRNSSSGSTNSRGGRSSAPRRGVDIAGASTSRTENQRVGSLAPTEAPVLSDGSAQSSNRVPGRSSNRVPGRSKRRSRSWKKNMEASSSKLFGDDDDDGITKDHKAILTNLKRKVLCNRGIDVAEKMRNNSIQLGKYTNGLVVSANQWGDKSLPGEDKLTFRCQKVLGNVSNADAGNDDKDNKDDGHTFAAPIIVGSSSSLKTPLRPFKLPNHPNVPPYTSWVYLDRNQRMTEDQSVQGRRRIYYDPVGNETLIASDSEEEEAEEEEAKHEFSNGEDYIIWKALQESGPSSLFIEQIAKFLHVNPDEVRARYELLLEDPDKQEKCEAQGESIRSKIPSPVGRRKGSRDTSRSTFKESKSGSKEHLKSAGNGTTRKPEDEKVGAKDLVAAMDSFDNVFCRRCLVFDCRLHGCSQPLVHPSERQAPVNKELEAMSPCGPDCYMLSQRARGGSPRPGVSGVVDSKVPAESSERGRLAKKQKDGEPSRGGEKQGSPTADGAETVAKRQEEGETSQAGEKEGSLNSHFDWAAKDFPRASPFGIPVSANGEDKAITPGQTAATPLLCLSSKADSVFPKREPTSVASRLTSHKKLARSATRKAIEEMGTSGGGSQHRGNVVDLTGMDEEFARKVFVGSQKRTAEEMSKATDVITVSGQLQGRHVSDGHGEELILQPEKSRFCSTKKLARSTKRALEVNTQSSTRAKDQRESRTDVQDTPVVKRLARTTENGTQGVFLDAISTPSRSAEGEKMDLTGSDLSKDKGKVTSPKILARSARGPLLLGTGELQKPLDLGKLPVPSSKAEKPVRDENARNSAARKLARSSRKALVEKVAVAIQQQQLQSPVDVSKNRGERENPIEIPDTVGTPQVPGIGNVRILADGGEKSEAHIANPDETYGVGSSQNAEKKSPTFADNHNEVKQDQTSAGPTKVGTPAKAMVPKNTDCCKRFEVKDDWTQFEKGLYEKGLQIYGKSSCVIASTLLKGCKTCAEVREYLQAQEAAATRGSEGGLHQFPDSLACALKWDAARARAKFYGKRKGSRKLKFTLKSAGNAIRKRMVNGKDAPQSQYTPCGCLFTCGKQCPCQLSGTCCEKYCGCAKSCKNRFRGCHCAKSQCCSRQCPCFAAGRECDPDVCRNCWIECGDGKEAGSPHREDKDNYQCHNMKLLLKQQQRVLLSRSDVAGWGAFLKDTVSKHDYLGEYTGEIISHREADKRGKIYDRENSSFLFNLNDKYVLDACRKGDKLKFANHSPNPNCYAKVIMVAGDHRVGIFAKERIMAGEELFYDYRYEPDRAPVWARIGDDSGSGKKDEAGPSERRSKQAS